MKNVLRIIAVLCLLLLITGCNPFVRKTYTVITDHTASEATDGEAVLEADTYEELVQCILAYVYRGAETGRVRLPSYDGDAEADIYAACQEVLTKTAIGSYALYDLDYYCTHVVSYYECQLIYSYAHTPEEIWSVVPVAGTEEMLQQIGETLMDFSPGLTMEINDASVTKLDVLALVKDAYYQQPVYAIEYPTVSVHTYPERGESRIVALEFSWSSPQSELLNKVAAVESAAVDVAGRKVSGDLSGAWQLYSRLSSRTSYQEAGGDGIYDALVLGQANSQGIALAYQALCKSCNITCYSVRGTRDDRSHWWNIITVDGISWHVDLTNQETEASFLHTDSQLESRYSWSGAEYPACDGDQGGTRESIE